MTSTPISYPFSFPLCDLLICEFTDAPVRPVGFPTLPRNIASVHSPSGPFSVSSSSFTLPRSIQKVSRVAQHIYQKVVRRKPVPYLPSQKNPKYILCTVEETLECGHKVTVYPSELETLTARKRNCHECSGWFGGLKLPDLKKPVASIKNAVRRNGTEGAGYWWPIVFALLMCLLFAYLGHRESQRTYTYTAPADRFQILKRADAHHYQFRWIHHGLDGKLTQELPAVFCPNYDPQMSAGQTIVFLRYVDLGSCWNIEPEGYGWSPETSDGLHPTLAPNCFVNLTDTTECKPNFLEANFPKEQ